MLTLSQPLTITVPRPFYQRLKREAGRRRTSVSGLLRTSFLFYTEAASEVYSDAELQTILKKDALPVGLKNDLDRLLLKK